MWDVKWNKKCVAKSMYEEEEIGSPHFVGIFIISSLMSVMPDELNIGNIPHWL